MARAGDGALEAARGCAGSVRFGFDAELLAADLLALPPWGSGALAAGASRLSAAPRPLTRSTMDPSSLKTADL